MSIFAPNATPMIEKSNCQHIGVITKAHGVSGEVVIRLNNGIDAQDITCDFLFLDLDGGLVPFYVQESRTRGDGALMVHFDSITTEVAARRLADVPVWVEGDELEMDEEGIHSSMLIGFLVVDSEHGELGKITEIRDPERNPYFVIEGGAGEILVPVADEYIDGLDDDQHILYITAPEGLIDLYL